MVERSRYGLPPYDNIQTEMSITYGSRRYRHDNGPDFQRWIWGHRRHSVLHERFAHGKSRLFLGFVIVTRRATFAASNPCLVAGPLVGSALFMRGASTSPGDLTLLLAIHRRESATATLVSFSHSALCHVEHPPVSVCLWDTP